MKLAYKKNDKITIRNYKSIPKIGVLSFGTVIDWELLNENNYFEVSQDPTYDKVMQQLGAYEIVENKAVKQVINKLLGTIEEEKAKKVKELNDIYQERISKAFYPWAERSNYEPIPEAVSQARLILVNECHGKEAEINALTELREVVSYEL